MDTISFLDSGYPIDAIGVAVGNRIILRIPSFYTPNDEWKIFSTIVHEYLHFVSYRSPRRKGILRRVGGRDEFAELNEAITEIVTFQILKEYLQKNKTPLRGENKYESNLTDTSYLPYVLEVSRILERVPLSSFIDAMLNEEGMERLKTAFRNEFGSEDALVDLGEKLKDFYIMDEKGFPQEGA